MADASVTVFSDLRCELGEGPSYDPQSEKLFWLDIRGKKLVEQKYPGGSTVAHDLPEMPSALAVIDGDRQLIVTETGFHVRDTRSGALSLHTPLEADNPATRSNDSRVHPSGAFWVGTMGKNAEAGAGAIYWFFKGELRKLYAGVSIPNSICFSEDGSVGYYTGVEMGLLMRVDCDPATGLPAGEPRVFVDHRGKGELDGSVMDRDGTLWNALWGAGEVNAYAPDGKVVTTIRMPASQVTCPAFVGPNADRLAVTSAWAGFDDERRRREPEAGKTFLLDIRVNGRFEPRVTL